MSRNIIRSITLGLKRRFRRGLTAALSSVGTIWLLTEIGTSAFSGIEAFFDAHHLGYLVATGLIAVATLLSYVYEPAYVSFKVPTTSTRVTIRFGDLFSGSDDLLIGVNEFFDHSLGHIVSPNSVHGQLITAAFHSDEMAFRQAVDAALAQVEGDATARTIQPSQRYPMGTTAVVPIGPRRAFLVVMAETDVATAKASTSVPKLWTALAGAWRSVHDYGNGRPVSLPLIGNGRASLNLEPQHLLRLITLSIVDFARKTGLPNSVTIVLPDGCFEQVAIREIARDWKQG